MKSIIKLAIAILAFVSIAVSCNRDDEENSTSKLEISNVEVGLNNSKLGYAGLDLHFQADVLAEAKVKTVKFEITPVSSGYGWVFLQDYSAKYSGERNPQIHEHFDVPEYTKSGDYSLMLIVLDEKGQKLVQQEVFKIENNPELPSLSGVQMSFSGAILSLKGNIKAINGIKSITLEINNETHALDSSDFAGKTEYSLDTTLDLQNVPKGHYHPVLTVWDKKGNKITYSPHLDKL